MAIHSDLSWPLLPKLRSHNICLNVEIIISVLLFRESVSRVVDGFERGPMRSFVGVIIDDKSWCFAYDPKAKWSVEWIGESLPWSKKIAVEKSRERKRHFHHHFLSLFLSLFFFFFFDSRGAAREELAPGEGQINITKM